MYVTPYGLKGITDGTFVVLPKFLRTSITPTFSNWNQLNSIIKSWIYSSVTSGMLGYLSRGMNAREQ